MRGRSSRGYSARRKCFCVVVIILCLGTTVRFLLPDTNFVLEPSEEIEFFQTLSIEAKQKADGVVAKINSVPSQLSTLKEQETEKSFSTNLNFPKSNEEYFRNSLVSIETKAYMYHHTPAGKEGTVILDMLLAHVYAFHQGAIYGGSCGEGNDVGREPENSLIRAIGLQDFIQFACPRDLETAERKKVIPGRSYVQDGTRAFTPDYIELLKGVVKHPKKQEDQKKTNIIVVHMSRGKKITPCTKAPHRGFEPYLPNKHYQLLINKYSKPDHENKVIIFSQSSSFEKFDEFREKGYELHIDGDISDVWSAALASDVFIMSRSSFSFVPAMVAGDSTKVVYTPFWDQPIRGWDIVRNDILAQSDVEFQHLKSTCKKKPDILAKYRQKKID
eukprot:CAMPEP_0168203950 /NCGR_PEP_ID=MMETSP0139_2-20121125/25137_1 /TAXON_ID=44445 /ORGANISM="Pseudo-nitzschia australis, Strain 10249 10 AB" /LENGTH=387 /DNA_ID=CAMNT_0008129855 /DNA_START=106 /DNA_END=1269 /DNA_ORIENTATION=+